MPAGAECRAFIHRERNAVSVESNQDVFCWFYTVINAVAEGLIGSGMPCLFIEFLDGCAGCWKDAVSRPHSRSCRCSIRQSKFLWSKKVQLPLWPEVVRCVPKGFLRSALFGAIGKGRRRYINGEDLAAIDGVTIRYKGERLDQGDLDVWANVLQSVRLQELGSQCRLTSYALLKLMGKTDTGKNRATLQARIERLVANAITVTQGRYSYMGNLIAGAAKDEETQQWVIELNPKLCPLFAADQFTQVEWAVRHALDGQPLAQWLHGYYASHAKPYPTKIETLYRLCGSEAGEMWKFAQTLRKILSNWFPPGLKHLGKCVRNKKMIRE